MSEGALMDIMNLTIETAAWICAPLVITILVVGILSQVFQSVTQLKDQSLTFIPKFFLTSLVFVLSIPWFIQVMQKYVDVVFTMIGKAAQ